MIINAKNLPKSQIELEITIPESEMVVPLDKAAERISQKKPIKGFRPGKAPRAVVEKNYGATAVLEEALEDLINKNLSEAVKKENVDIISRPEVSILQAVPNNPLKFKAVISILPEIKLGEYKNIKPEGKEIELNPKKAEEKDIQEALDYLLKSRADKDDALPEINDDFAKSLGKFDSVDALKASLKEGLEKENLMKEQERVRIAVLKEIVKNSEMEIPEVLVNKELERMIAEINENVERMGMKFEDYLKQIKKTVEDLKKEWYNQAEERVKSTIVLMKIAEKENVEISEEELDRETSLIISILSETPEEVAKKIDMFQFRENVRARMANGKVLELLERLNIKK